MVYLQSAGIVHRKITPSNIIVESKTFKAQLIDFQYSHLDSSDLIKPDLPESPFNAPECKSSGQQIPSPKMDIYSLGVIFHLLLLNSLPDSPKNNDEMETDSQRELFDLKFS